VRLAPRGGALGNRAAVASISGEFRRAGERLLGTDPKNPRTPGSRSQAEATCPPQSGGCQAEARPLSNDNYGREAYATVYPMSSSSDAYPPRQRDRTQIRLSRNYAGPVAWLAGTAALGVLLSQYLNYHPRPVERLMPCNVDSPPVLEPAHRIRAMTFNVQFLAGTGYHFFYDGGPDTLVARNDIEKIATKVASVLTNSAADLILLQEVDSCARRTAYIDQLALLLAGLPRELQNHVSAYYWKSKFVPHPKVLGSAGTQLVTLSRYRVDTARRYQLPYTPGNFIERDFNLKRAILEADLPISNGRCVKILNTHLEAFPKGSHVMERQIQKLLERLNQLTRSGQPWILGGDLNLLPPGQSTRLAPQNRGIHHEPSELGAIYERYSGVPPILDATGHQMQRCFTFTKKAGGTRVPVRTLDYFFASPMVKIERYVVPQDEMMDVSDHLPLIAEFTLPEAGGSVFK
jgi:endonuclease/exonuclease/phosphatase family metal-dependent hydrolase